ncbi:MAG TPA: DUF2382 domain-containing protein [Pyrinomonadaceae bacterium]|nr:DUF2382 domain-containing protein [Pyrinomonadaceae bacterium]
MAKTVIGMFRNSTEAREAVRQLINSGISREDIGITSNDFVTEGASGVDASDRSRTTHSGEGIGESISNFFRSLFGDKDANQARYYSDAVSRGGVVVTVDTDSDEIAGRAASILNRYGADVDEGGARYDTSSEDYTASDAMTASNASAASNAAYTSGEGTRGRADYAGESETLPVIEEELRIGKREVERGGVRVRTHVVERPVEEVVRLREERVRVERRPVNRPVTDADLQAFREGTIEITERAEEVVVDKQARVVEEVIVGKEVQEHSETIRDTVRRTDVEVEELGPDAQRNTRAKGTVR